MSSEKKIDKSSDESIKPLESTIDYRMVGQLMAIHSSIDSEGSSRAVLDCATSVTHELFCVERVQVVMRDRDMNDALMPIIDFANQTELIRVVANSVATTGQTLRISSSVHHDILNGVPQEVKATFSNLMCTALKSGNGDVVGVITVLNKVDRINPRVSMPFTETDEFLMETLALNAGVALSKASAHELACREKWRYSALVSVLKARSCEEPLDVILRKTMEVIAKLLKSDLVSIYLVDHETQEAVICASKDGLEGYTVTFGQGIAGTVAKNGGVIRIMNAYSDKRFDPNVDNCTGLITKTMMCVPVPGFHENTVAAAVVQAINKVAGDTFDAFDEESLVLLCTELSNVLRSKAIELYDLRNLASSGGVNGGGKKSDSDMELQQSLLREYGSKRYKAVYLMRSLSRTDSFRTRRNTLGSTTGLIKLHDLDINAVDMMSEETVQGRLSCHNTDPFLLDDMTLIYLANHMLDTYGLIERFRLNLDRLRHFLIAVHKMYHERNAFHNFKHAWGTMHLTYQILNHGADEYLTSIDILALLLAAICHDLDHPGNNNAFEVATGSALAVTYADDTVLERHHCSSALKLLNAPEHDFLENLSPCDKARLKKTMTASIMATDMSQHFSLVEQLVSHGLKPVPFCKKDSDERIILTRLVLHCADIGAQTQRRELALKWTERCLDEFAAQGVKEHLLGLELTPFMQGLDSELTRMQVQEGFVGGIVVPLWSALASCFQELVPAANQAVANRTFYATRVAALTEEQMSRSM